MNTQILTEYYILKDGVRATIHDLGFSSVIGFSCVCDTIKELRDYRPNYTWTYEKSGNMIRSGYKNDKYPRL